MKAKPATFHWANGRVTHENVPIIEGATKGHHFDSAGLHHYFSPTGQTDKNGFEIWREDQARMK